VNGAWHARCNDKAMSCTPLVRRLAVTGVAAIFFGSLAAAKGAPNPAVPAKSRAELMMRRDHVAQATVTIPDKSCAGAVVGTQTQVITAAHCIPEHAREVGVVLRHGTRLTGRVQHVDRDTDMALLELAQPAAVTPLALSTQLPKSGANVLFVGRVDRESRTQVARIERLGRCPSLPGVDRAVFTNVQAKPGDSGAPLLDRELRVVALIHGGAACHIAAPTAQLGKALATGTLEPQQDAADPFAPQRQAERAPQRSGPLSFERQPNGFRFRMNWRWSTDSAR
jgi:S1-C subfamily serine protease